MIWWRNHPPLPYTHPGIVVTIGLAVTLYLAYAAFFILKELCVFCLVTYAAVIALFIVTGSATAIPMMSLPRRFLRDRFLAHPGGPTGGPAPTVDMNLIPYRECPGR